MTSSINWREFKSEKNTVVNKLVIYWTIICQLSSALSLIVSQIQQFQSDNTSNAAACTFATGLSRLVSPLCRVQYTQYGTNRRTHFMRVSCEWRSMGTDGRNGTPTARRTERHSSVCATYLRLVCRREHTSKMRCQRHTRHSAIIITLSRTNGKCWKRTLRPNS